MKISSFEIKKGINLHYIETAKFKTTTLGVYIRRPLSRGEAAKNALLASLLRRGCPEYPETALLSKRLEELYGARLDTGVRKRGDCQILHINFEFANERYIAGAEPMFDSVASLARSVVTGQTGFSPEYTEREKENLKQQILSRINDKRSFARSRCIEIMCENEPYGLSELGQTEDIDAITADELYSHYKNVVLKSPADIFICGKADISRVCALIGDTFAGCGPDCSDSPEMKIVTSVDKIKTVTETAQVEQGKLSMGFRTKIDPAGGKYPALLVYNAIFGGEPWSKLFMNVRERLSLAYYASSSVDMFKGVMNVNSGIEAENFDRAKDEIIAQLSEMKAGNISDDEMSAAALATVTRIRSTEDSAIMTEDYWLNAFLAGTAISPEELTELISRVTKEQVVEVAEGVELDTIYFLKGEQ